MRYDDIFGWLSAGRRKRQGMAARRRALADVLAKPNDRLLQDAGLLRHEAERLL